MTRVARLFHESDIKQPESAARLRLSQPNVSRLLRHAQWRLIVRLTMRAPTGPHHAITTPAAGQKDPAERFALKGAARWAGVAFTDGAGGSPLLAGAAATFECFNRSRYEEGDHVIFVGEVERCSHRAGASPLLFHGGRFFTEHPL